MGTSFKRHLDSFMYRKALEEYEPNAGQWDQLKQFGQHGQIGLKGPFPCCVPLTQRVGYPIKEGGN